MTPILLSSATFLLLFLTTSATMLDIDGKPVIAGDRYRILPAIRGRGGELGFQEPNRTLMCPLFASQYTNESEKGVPVKFYPLDNSTQVPIALSSDLNVAFDTLTICVTSYGWNVDYDPNIDMWLVGSWGITGKPEKINNWFKIEKVDNKYYKFVYCPSFCKTCRHPVCGDVGVLPDVRDQKRGLVISKEPLLVVFKKVSGN